MSNIVMEGTSTDEVHTNMQLAVKRLQYFGTTSSIRGETKKENWLQRKIAVARFTRRMKSDQKNGKG